MSKLPTWAEFMREAPEIAAWGESRLVSGLPSFLATVRGDALPRVHPVDARVKQGHLGVYMFPRSPKGFDLSTDGRFALHCGVGGSDGGDGEFMVRGWAHLATGNAERTELLLAAGLRPVDGYILFELHPVEAFACTYERPGEKDAETIIKRWKHQATAEGSTP